MTKPYSFTIEGVFTPSTIPMERLAEYMAAFAKMLGEEAYVHFERVVEGSVALKAKADEPARPKILERLKAVRNGTASRELRRHFDHLDGMLRRDNAYGALTGEDVVIPFPGAKRSHPAEYGPFRQQGTIDGEVYRIGGKDSSKHIHIHSNDRDLSVLYASEQVALRLRHHLFGGTLRFRGEGSWFRHGDGEWELRNFRVDDFEELESASLLETVRRLRKATRDELAGDPVSAVLLERGSTGDVA